MPYELKDNCVKKTDGTTVKCHASREEAVRHLRALYANVEDAKGWSEEQLETYAKEHAPDPELEKYYDYYTGTYEYIPWGVTSFAELDQYHKAEEEAKNAYRTTNQFRDLIGNVMSSDKPNKRSLLKKLVDEFSSRVGLSDSDSKSHEEQEVTIWKDAEGKWRWKGIFSNNRWDRDDEQLSDKAHENFVKMIEMEIVDYPELWIWHTPSATIGKADSIKYQNGFNEISGYFYEDKEYVAEILSTYKDLGMSHGMPKSKIIRNKDNPKIIDAYVSKEVSVLPRAKAANLLTEFTTEVKSMGKLTDEKKKFLRETVGYDENTIEREFDSKDADTLIEKEQEEVKTDETEKVETAPEIEESKEGESTEKTEPVQEETKKVETPELDPKPETKESDTDYVRKDEIVSILADMVKNLNILTEKVAQLETQQNESKSESEPVLTDKDKSETPRLSLIELVHKSVIGKNETRVDGRTMLAKDGPEETVANPVTGISFVDNMIAACRNNNR